MSGHPSPFIDTRASARLATVLCTVSWLIWGVLACFPSGVATIGVCVYAMILLTMTDTLVRIVTQK